VNLQEPVSAIALMDDAVRVNQPAIDKHAIKLIREYGDCPRVVLDQHRVLQILINLVGNAARALGCAEGIDRQLTLKISAKQSETSPTISFEVIDNGVGIAPENLTRIFTYGFTTRKDGHGFGLHSSANAAREMGGALTVSSDGPGLGATFALELPLQTENSDASPSQSNGKVAT
jgi:two-component system, NtrC family, sensor kinase